MTKELLDNFIDRVPQDEKLQGMAWVSPSVYKKIKKYLGHNDKYRGLFFSTDPTIKKDKVIIQ